MYEKITGENQKILYDYYSDGAKKLNAMINSILKLKFPCLSEKDYDVFYDIAVDLFLDVCEKYDGRIPFEQYYKPFLLSKIKTGMTAHNRKKRCQRVVNDDGSISYLYPVSIDTPVGDSECECTLKEIIESDFNLEDEVIMDDEITNEKIILYLDKLSKIQRKIAIMISNDYSHNEIEHVLGITHNQYLESISAIKSYNNISVLM